MDLKYINAIAEAMRQVDEKKTLDPVNPKAAAKDFDDRADKDIDNDGDTDSTDKYLHKRRKAIGKSMAKESFDDLEENKYPMASKWMKGAKSVKGQGFEFVRGRGVHTIKKNGKAVGDFSLEDDSDLWVINLNGVRGQVTADEIDDIPRLISNKIKESVDAMEECPDCGGSMENHEPDCPRAKAADKKKLDDDKDLDTDNSRKALKHDCATHVTSEQWGYGECISGQHTIVEQEDGTGVVTHYDVMFEHGIEENVAVEDLTILREKSHLHASKKKMKEAKQPNQSGTKAEPFLDKFKGKGAQDMAKDNNVDNPKVELDGVEIEKEKTAGVKQSPPRSPADKLSVGDKKPVKQGAK